MTISPGARKAMKATPSTAGRSAPSARVKMARKTSVVMTGASTVCVITLRKRRTSLA